MAERLFSPVQISPPARIPPPNPGGRSLRFRRAPLPGRPPPLRCARLPSPAGRALRRPPRPLEESVQTALMNSKFPSQS